jgi:transforming growth factor-beta-induced protein
MICERFARFIAPGQTGFGFRLPRGEAAGDSQSDAANPEEFPMSRWISMTLLTTGAAALLGMVGLQAARAEAQKDIVETAVEAGSFKTLAAALQAGGLVEALKSEGPFTVFAPTDEAFARLPEGAVANLLKPENKDQLVAVLKYHVVEGKVTADQVSKLKGAKTLNGQQVRIDTSKGVRINESNVVKADIQASNGVIHVIDRVLLPK